MGSMVITVAHDGSADFATVQEAIDAVLLGNKCRTVIQLALGVYKQPVYVPRTSPQKPNRQFASEISERTRSLLQILNKLESWRLFLVLIYIGRQKLETVMTMDDANDILSMKDRPMTYFESKIWDSYGRHFYEKSDRSEPASPVRSEIDVKLGEVLWGALSPIPENNAIAVDSQEGSSNGLLISSPYASK